jgi:hypothetical protein
VCIHLRILFLIFLLMSNLISTPSMAMGELPLAVTEAPNALSQSQASSACHMNHAAASESAHQHMSMHGSADNNSVDCDDSADQLCKIQCELSACSAMLLGLSSQLSLPILDNDTPAFSYSRVFPKQQQESLYRPPLIG